MCISKAIRCPERLFPFLLVALLAWAPAGLQACSCEWKGAFLKVAGGAPLIVRGTILRHRPGPVPMMDVHVLETLAGGLLDSGLEIQMDNGMMCRPPLGLFPVGSEWILALNGPGAKPGTGLAISVCGEYWLRVDGPAALGSFDGPQQQSKRMPLEELRGRLRYPAFRETFAGRVAAGQRYLRAFGGRFELVLEPTPEGWEIVVREVGREENLARLTPPLHFLPNPRDIEAWQFQARVPTGCPRPHGEAPPPARTRDFCFSPDVGRSLQGSRAKFAVTPEEVAAVERFGRGRLKLGAAVVETGPGGCPRIASLEFEVEVAGGYSPSQETAASRHGMP
jgi:hypothetical protein